MLITPLSDGEGQAAKRRGGGASYNPGHSLPSPTGRGEPPSGGEGEGLRPLTPRPRSTFGRLPEQSAARGRGFYLLLNKCFFSSVVKLS